MKTPTKQQKKILRLAKVADLGEIGIVEEINSIEDRIEAVEEKMANIKDGIDGKDAVITLDIKKEIAGMIDVPIVEKVIHTIEKPTVTEIIKNVESTVTGERIVQDINGLPLDDEFLFDIERVRGLLERLKRMEENRSRPFYVGGGVSSVSSGGSSGVSTWSTSPETADGTNTVFTVGAVAPTDVVAGGILYFPTDDYTFAAGQITFISIQPVNSVHYR